MSAPGRRARRALLGAAALALVLSAARASGEAPAPEPPFHVTADNLTGGRGPEGDVLFLNGDLRVTRGRTLLTADNGQYYRATGRIDLRGHVKLIDSTTTATCEHATFSENDDRLNLDGDVVIVDHDATLRAPIGWYDRRDGTAWVGGGVTGTEKDQRMRSDQATYHRDSALVQARGEVHGWDDANHLELTADSIDFHRLSRVAVATGSPVLKSTDDEGHATYLRALKLRVNSATRIAEAMDSVTVERDTLRARADSATFDDRTGHGFLYGSPRAWDNETTVSGDTLETLTQDRRLRRVVVHGHATMDYAARRDTSSTETSRLTGKRVDVFVVENRIDSLIAVGAAQNLYSAAAHPGKTSERNRANGDTILVWFKDRKVDHARVVGSAHGEYRGPVAAGDTAAAAAEVVAYDAKRIDFVVPTNKIVLDGDSHLTYRDLALRATRVEFDSEKQTLVARGKPQLVEKGDKLDGHMMTYDLTSHVGTVYQAQTAYEKGIYRGDRIRKSGDNELDVMNGSYTTCDLDDPHYHFSSRWMKIYLKDKLVAKPVVFYIRNVPVFALPFYVFPIKPGRHSGFLFPQFEFGFNNQGGQFLRNAGYYWAPNDYMDLTLAGDYYQAQPDWAIRADGDYKLLYHFDGTFSGRFERNEALHRDDYVFDGSHEQDLTPRTRMIARGDFVSSRTYQQSTFNGYTLAQQLNRFLTSTLSISHSADWASFNGTIDRRQDLDADVALLDPLSTGHGPPAPVGTRASLPSLTISAPSLAVSFPTRTLGSYAMFKDTKAETALASTYFSLSAQYLSLTTQQAYMAGFLNTSLQPDSAVRMQNTTRRGFTANTSLSDSRRLWGWLNFAPGVFANGAVFDFDELGHKIVPAATWSSSMALSSTFYGTFKPPIPGLVGIRHVIAPSIGLSYSPNFDNLEYRDSLGVLHNRFNSFGNVAISGFRSELMTFGVDQRLQVKVKDGDQVRRLDNLVSWSTTGSYNFLWREQHLPHGLSPLGTSVLLQPPGVTNASASAVVDPYFGRPLRSLTYGLGFNISSSGAKKTPAALAVDQSIPKEEIVSPDDFKDTWHLSLSYSYSGGYSSAPNWSAQKTANAVASYQLSPNWQIDYSAAYDITRSQVLTQSYTLTRRIHCWDAMFQRTFRPGLSDEYYFRLGVRDQKEIYYERGSRAQSLGGLQ